MRVPCCSTTRRERKTLRLFYLHAPWRPKRAPRALDAPPPRPWHHTHQTKRTHSPLKLVPGALRRRRKPSVCHCVCQCCPRGAPFCWSCRVGVRGRLRVAGRAGRRGREREALGEQRGGEAARRGARRAARRDAHYYGARGCSAPSCARVVGRRSRSREGRPRPWEGRQGWSSWPAQQRPAGGAGALPAAAAGARGAFRGYRWRRRRGVLRGRRAARAGRRARRRVRHGATWRGGAVGVEAGRGGVAAGRAERQRARRGSRRRGTALRPRLSVLFRSRGVCALSAEGVGEMIGALGLGSSDLRSLR